MERKDCNTNTRTGFQAMALASAEAAEATKRAAIAAAEAVKMSNLAAESARSARTNK